MSTVIRQRALQTWVLSICIIAVLLSLKFFALKQCILFNIHYQNFIVKKNLSGFAIWYNLSALYFFANSYLFYLVLLKITLFNSLRWEKSLEIVMKMLRVEKVGAHAAFWENLWAKAGPNRASVDSSEKRIMLDYQLIVLLVKVVHTTFSENSELVWEVQVRIHVAPLACHPFINIKLAAYHFCFM